MASKRKQVARAVPVNAADIRANPYIQRLLEDEELRNNLRAAVDSSRSAYTRLSNGKAPARTLLADKKLQGDLRDAMQAARDAGLALSEAPQQSKSRKGIGIGGLLLLALVGATVAVAVNEKLRSKVLDALFGSEEEFEYTPPPSSTAPPPPPPSTPVSAA
ncbi:MAG: hypothetical protein JO168_15875 [Solirubrobacterales bacterium]|nr:hypothetical protein [Solirubrobacterales bacterium]MBV9716152.1 hypothetical protein [Solirubrobacterales bacterium]